VLASLAAKQADTKHDNTRTPAEQSQDVITAINNAIRSNNTSWAAVFENKAGRRSERTELCSRVNSKNRRSNSKIV
jgi:hypothetical protein